ncbi:MAG: alcohol dehydrogenase catalytic domain-containing protein [Pirellulaceae bacterium]
MRAIAAFTGSTEPGFVELPSPPTPAAGEVLCRTLQLGVCGTDREILGSAAPLVPAGEVFLVLGHECLAEVEAVGDGVVDVSPGDLVVPVVRRSQGRPTARVDMLPFGAYTERGIVVAHGFSPPRWLDRPEHLIAVPGGIADLAVLAEPLAVSEKGVNEALTLQKARLGQTVWTAETPPRVLVTGMGPIGFAAVIACRARNWPVTLFGRDDVDSFRAQLAVALGAAYLPDAEGALEPDDVEQTGFDLILECTGADSVMVRAASALASCGVLVWLGSSRQPRPRDLNVAGMMRHGVLRNHVHVGCVNAAPRDFRDALSDLTSLAVTHRVQLSSLITDRVAPEDSLWHFTNRRPQGIKTILEYATP